MEAVALLLESCGEREEACMELVRYVKINNKAHRLKKAKELPSNHQHRSICAQAVIR